MEHQKDAGRIINIVSNQIKRRFDTLMFHETLTGVQGRVLHYILSQTNERDLFQKDIEEEFNLRRSTATGILQLMEKNGFLHREGVDYDARLKKIIVSEKGSEIQELADENIRILEAKLQQNISETDLKTFFKVMNQMSKNLE